MPAIDNIAEIKPFTSGPKETIDGLNEIIAAVNACVAKLKEKPEVEEPIHIMVLRDDASDWIVVEVNGRIVQTPAYASPDFNSTVNNYYETTYDCAVCYCDCSDSGSGVVGDV